MPELKPYTSSVEGLTPSDRGVSAYNQVARTANRVFTEQAATTEQSYNFAGKVANQVGDTLAKVVTDYQDHQQIANAATATSTFMDNKTKEWNNKVNGYTEPDGTVHPPADPRDPKLQDEFMDGLEKSFDELRQSVSTPNAQRFMEAHIEQMRSSFRVHTTADMSSLAYDAAKVNLRQTTNSAVSMVTSNPSMVDDALLNLRAQSTATFSSNPYLRGAQGSKLNQEYQQAAGEQIVDAAARKAIRMSSDPVAEAEKWLGKYPPYFPGAKAEYIAAFGQAAERANQRAQEHQQLVQDKQFEQAANARAADILSRGLKIDEKGAVTLDPASFGQMLDLATDKSNPKAMAIAKAGMSAITTIAEDAKKLTDGRTDPRTYNDFLARASLPESDPRHLTSAEVYQARGNHQLSTTDMVYFKEFVTEGIKNPELVQDRKDFDAFMGGFKAQVTHSTMFKSDGLGDQRYMELVHDKWEQFRAAKAAGVPKSSLLNASDPKNLLATGTPFKKYLETNPQALERFTNKAVMGENGQVMDLVPGVNAAATFDERFGAAPGAWQKGESMDALFKRLNGGK